MNTNFKAGIIAVDFKGSYVDIECLVSVTGILAIYPIIAIAVAKKLHPIISVKEPSGEIDYREVFDGDCADNNSNCNDCGAIFNCPSQIAINIKNTLDRSSIMRVTIPNDAVDTELLNQLTIQA